MRGEQAIFNLEIKRKSGLSLNPDIHDLKVPSSVLRIANLTIIRMKTTFHSFLVTAVWCSGIADVTVVCLRMRTRPCLRSEAWNLRRIMDMMERMKSVSLTGSNQLIGLVNLKNYFG